jgi:hypothetical protein
MSRNSSNGGCDSVRRLVLVLHWRIAVRGTAVAKKADQEAAHSRYTSLLDEAKTAERNKDFHIVVTRAEAALPSQRDSLAFQRRYLKIERPPLPAVDLLTRYAPPLFAYRVLDALEAWIAECKKAERDAYPHLRGQLETARQVMATASRVWSAWQADLDTPAGEDKATVTALAKVWSSAGAIIRRPDTTKKTYAVVTRVHQEVWGKCPSCGRPHRATYLAMLEPLACPGCAKRGTFTITKRDA